MQYGYDFFITQRSRLGGPSRFLEYIYKTHRKFIEIFEKNFHLKKWGLSEYSNLTFDFIFQNFNFFDFSWHRIILLYRTVTIFSLTQRSVFGGLSRYCENVCKVHRKCGRSFFKLHHKKWRFLENSNLDFRLIFQNLNAFDLYIQNGKLCIFNYHENQQSKGSSWSSSKCFKIKFLVHFKAWSFIKF